MNQELITANDPQQTQQTQPLSPLVLMQQCMVNGGSVDMLERLMALYERVQATEAKRQYVDALSRFQKNRDRIVKDASIKHSNRHISDYATLGNIISTISDTLGECGLSFQWSFEQKDGMIGVTTTLYHVGGHSESITVYGPPDSAQAMNALQRSSSSETYLQRRGLRAILGLPPGEAEDDDGNGYGAQQAQEKTLTHAEQNHVRQLLQEVGKTEEGLLKFLNCSAIDNIPAKRYTEITQMLIKGKKCLS